MFNTTYSEKLYIRAQLKFWAIFLGILLLLILDLFYIYKTNNFTIKTLEFLITILLGYFLYPAFSAVTKKMDKIEDKILDEARKSKLGMDGEEKIYKFLKKILSEEQYFILPNVVLPKHIFDIDFVIIGPKGIILLEAKNLSGQYLFSNDEYFKIENGQKSILPQDFDPREEVRRHLYYLRKYFESKGYTNIRILKALVFTDSQKIVIDGDTGIYIAKGFDSLKNFFDNTTIDPIYTPELCGKLKDILQPLS